MRIMRRAWGLTAFAAAALILTNGALSASDSPVVHVKAVVKDGAVTLDAQANGPFEYTTYRPSESLYVLDLSGVSAGDSSGARVVPSELVKSYRLTHVLPPAKSRGAPGNPACGPAFSPALERNGNRSDALRFGERQCRTTPSSPWSAAPPAQAQPRLL